VDRDQSSPQSDRYRTESVEWHDAPDDGDTNDWSADTESGRPEWVVEFGPDGIRRRRADGQGGWERYDPEPDPDVEAVAEWQFRDGEPVLTVAEGRPVDRYTDDGHGWGIGLDRADEPTRPDEPIRVRTLGWLGPDRDGPAPAGPRFAVGTPQQRARAAESWADAFRKSGWRAPRISRASLALIGAARRSGWSRCEYCDRPVPPRFVAASEPLRVPICHPACRRKAERRRALDTIYGARVVAAEVVRGSIGQFTSVAGVVVGNVATAVIGPFRDAVAAVRWTFRDR